MLRHAYVSSRVAAADSQSAEVSRLRQETGGELTKGGAGGQSSRTLSLDNFIASLEKRKYFEPGGAVRDAWNVVYGRTVDEAWDRAFEKDRAISLQVRDYEVVCITDVLKAKWTAEGDRARKLAKEAVEKGLRNFKGLPPDTRTRAVRDAEILANLIVLKDAKIKGWDSYYNLMVEIKEIWDSGFGRYTIVDGKHLVYGVRPEPAPDNIIRL